MVVKAVYRFKILMIRVVWVYGIIIGSVALAGSLRLVFLYKHVHSRLSACDGLSKLECMCIVWGILVLNWRIVWLQQGKFYVICLVNINFCSPLGGPLLFAKKIILNIVRNVSRGEDKISTVSSANDARYGDWKECRICRNVWCVNTVEHCS